MANGIAAGFAGNEVMFSEAYLPYAWPEVNRHTTAEDIVAVCPLGTSLVVATKGEPYLFSGVSPSTISGSKIPSMQACLSRQSMVAMEGFVLYAGTNGLVSVDANGNAALATDRLFHRSSGRLSLIRPPLWLIPGVVNTLPVTQNRMVRRMCLSLTRQVWISGT